MKAKLIYLFLASAFLAWTFFIYFPGDIPSDVDDATSGIKINAGTDHRPAAELRSPVSGRRNGTGHSAARSSAESASWSSGPQVIPFAGRNPEKAWSDRSGFDNRNRRQLRIISQAGSSTGIQQIYSLDDRDAIPILSQALAENGDEKIRLEALLALDAIEGDEAVNALSLGLSDDEVRIRQEAIEALWSRGSQTTHFLGQVLFGDPDPWLRLRAVELLAEDGGAAARSLLQAAVEDPDPEVSLTAEALLKSWTQEPDAYAESMTRDSSDLDTASETKQGTGGQAPVDSPDPEERIAAIQELYGIGGEEAISILGDILARDQDGFVRQEAVSALGSIGGDAAVAAIALGLSDEDAAVRQRATETLWNQGSHTVYLIGQVLFGDPDPAVRYQAVELLAADATPAAMALLQSATEDPDEAVRQAARQKLNLPEP